MVTLFAAHIRTIIYYCSAIWHTRYVADLHLLEFVQRRWTKQVEGLYDLSYRARLRKLGLFSVSGRLLRADIIKVWKAFHPETEVGLSEIFELARDHRTRGLVFKLAVPRMAWMLKRDF